MSATAPVALAPEKRAYAELLDDTPQTQTAAAREKSWEAVVQQMNYISAREFSRAGGPAAAGENVYSGGEPGPMAKLLSTASRSSAAGGARLRLRRTPAGEFQDRDPRVRGSGTQRRSELYQFTKDDSNLPGYSLTSHQVGFQIGYSY